MAKAEEIYSALQKKSGLCSLPRIVFHTEAPAAVGSLSVQGDGAQRSLSQAEQNPWHSFLQAQGVQGTEAERAGAHGGAAPSSLPGRWQLALP